jgi:AAA+ ATPase superfamily predicted ATPase
MSNPFYYGGHVSPGQFVGRRSELRRIFAALEIAHTGQLQSVSVVGPRRIGKSSLLFYISSAYSRFLMQPTNYRFAYINLQDAECKRCEGLLRRILKGLQITPLPSGRLSLPRFQEVIFRLKNDHLYPVICLDEFEELLDRQGEFTNDLYDSWRHLINENVLAFVTASKVTLNELAANNQFTSPFFNIFTLLSLSKFSDEEALELTDRGYTCDRPFSRSERDLVWDLGEDHPYKIQLAGSLVYLAKANGANADQYWVRREFQRQVEAAGFHSLTLIQDWQAKVRSGLPRLLTSPKYLGRLLLELMPWHKRDDFSESTAWLIGVVIIWIGVGLFIGWLHAADIVSLWNIVIGSNR